MTLKLAAFALFALALPVQAETSIPVDAPPSSPGTSTNSTTILAATVLSPGKYSATVAPGFNGAMGKRIASALKEVDGISAASAKVDDSTIHFAVKDNSNVRVADVQNAVAKASSDSVTSIPMLESSISTVAPVHQ